MTRSIPYLRPILYALTGYTFWVFADASLKYATASPLPRYEIMALMSLVAVATIAVITIGRGKAQNLKPQNPRKIIILGFLLLTNILTLLVAFKRLPLVSVYAITFTGPMLTAFFAALLLQERVTWRQGLAILAGFCGVLIAIDPLRILNAPGDAWGYAAAFLSLALNVSILLLLRLYGETEHHESLAFYPRVVAAVGGLVPCVFWHFEPVSFAQLIPITAAGSLAGIGWLFITVACKTAPASIVAPYRYSQIVTGAVVGYFVWHDRPTANLFAGVAIIILSGLYFARRLRNNESLPLEAET